MHLNTLIQISVFFGLAIILFLYRELSQGKKGKLPKIPIGLFVLYLLIGGAIPIFRLNNLNGTANSLDVAGTIVVWMAILRLIVFFTVDYFLRQKRGYVIPTITRDFALAIIYLVVAMIVLKQRTDVNLGSLITTSAILTAVIGFAMQDTLGNLFSGLALQLEHPYQIDDWIGFESIIGKVVGITWKSTKILTGTDEMIFVPNNTIAKSVLKNFSRPTPMHTTFIDVGASYDAEPHKVRDALIGVVKDHPKVSSARQPEARIVKYDNFSVNYRVIFATEDFSTEDRTKSEILNNIWYRFRRDGIKIPYPVQEERARDYGDIIKEEETSRNRQTADTEADLGAIDTFNRLSPDARKYLAGQAAVLQFAAGENIVKQGGETGPMYVIKNGACSVLIAHDGGVPAEVAKLSRLDMFGEMSVLTGAPRTATVRAVTNITCYEIEKSDMYGLFAEYPDALTDLSAVLIERRAKLDAQMSKMAEAATSHAEAENQLVSKIKAFLGL